jgi:phage baseplate assembly protein W
MYIPSSNTQTRTSYIGIIYSDFTDNFNKAPFSNDLAKITNENSVKQSLKNICLTHLGERLYDNSIGTIFQVFGQNDAIFQSVVSQSLTDAIRSNEPRCNLLGINVDSTSIPNALSVTIYFTVINIPGNQSVNILINRIR